MMYAVPSSSTNRFMSRAIPPAGSNADDVPHHGTESLGTRFRRYESIQRNGPRGESAIATPASARAYVDVLVGDDGPSECTHMTHLPVNRLYITFGRSRIDGRAHPSVRTSLVE